jgi:hypothetical protein
MYWTLERPVLMYACEIRVLKETIKQKLLVLERKILRRMFGPNKERYGTWRIKTNDQLNKLIENKTVINYIKSQNLGLFGRVYRMPDERMVKKGV